MSQTLQRPTHEEALALLRFRLREKGAADVQVAIDYLIMTFEHAVILRRGEVYVAFKLSDEEFTLPTLYLWADEALAALNNDSAVF